MIYMSLNIQEDNKSNSNKGKLKQFKFFLIWKRWRLLIKYLIKRLFKENRESFQLNFKGLNKRWKKINSNLILWWRKLKIKKGRWMRLKKVKRMHKIFKDRMNLLVLVMRSLIKLKWLVSCTSLYILLKRFINF